jgi:hypothetical protein
MNLASLLPALPPVIIPNGTTHQIMPLTARGYELFKEVRQYQAAANNGELVDDSAYLDIVDELLALVLPTATPDDLASFGFRIEIKLGPILAAAGRVDDVLNAIAEAEADPNREALPDPSPAMGSVAPSPDTPRPLGATG